jgi:hypothetical protein
MEYVYFIIRILYIKKSIILIYTNTIIKMYIYVFNNSNNNNTCLHTRNQLCRILKVKK